MAERVIRHRQRATPTRTGVVLDSEVIVAAAIRLLEEHGTLSVRQLGTELGADPSAIYRYFRNVDALLLAVADRMVGEAMDGFEPSGDWVASLRDLAMRGYRAYLAHPQAARAVAARTSDLPNTARMIDTIIGVLLSAGFDGATAVRLCLSLGDLMLAFATLDAGFALLSPDARKADEATWARLGTLDPDTHPHIAAVAGHFSPDLDSFPATLDLLLASFAALAPGGAIPGRP
ncbi:MAG TPA: TetR/AcrR family transcriptional regulator [Thermomonospora sp.]|nr:TetR/AcrR family transcriptional regulator [Thermomonospora sp.]